MYQREVGRIMDGEMVVLEVSGREFVCSVSYDPLSGLWQATAYISGRQDPIVVTADRELRDYLIKTKLPMAIRMALEDK